MTDSFLYLDHAATAYPRHPRVAEAMAAALNIAGSAGRGGHGGARGASWAPAGGDSRICSGCPIPRE
ncbi:MAG: hypothetical protein ACE5GW_07740 [Planctomycetota bacterium]